MFTLELEFDLAALTDRHIDKQRSFNTHFQED